MWAFPGFLIFLWECDYGQKIYLFQETHFSFRYVVPVAISFCRWQEGSHAKICRHGEQLDGGF